MQFCVILDKTQPENVIESYTFAFKYDTSANTTDRYLDCIVSTENGGKFMNRRHVRADIAKINRTLILLTQDLPHLPG